MPASSAAGAAWAAAGVGNSSANIGAAVVIRLNLVLFTAESPYYFCLSSKIWVVQSQVDCECKGKVTANAKVDSVRLLSHNLGQQE
jgi:hypothetical protein